MSHWAEIDENNTVIRVVVGNNEDPAGDEGRQWIVDTLGGNWVKTSYNSSIRKNFAGTGFTYDEIRDAFIPPQLFSGWVLNEETCRWEAPVPYPEDGNSYVWDEESVSWKAAEEAL